MVTKIEVADEMFVRSHIVKDYTIDVKWDEDQLTLELSKSWNNDEYDGFDSEWNWANEANKVSFETLPEEVQEEVLEFIEELTPDYK